jgi:hypothetical protein
VFNFQIKKPEVITDNRTATFQNASGTVAYLSDIPEVNVVDIVAGDNISITEDEGVFTINSLGNENPYVRNVQLRNSLTNTTYFESEDCVFEYDELEAPINSVRFLFNENISYESFDFDETILGRAYFYYQNETIEFFNLTTENSLIIDNYIEFNVPFSDYYFEATLTPRTLKEVSFTLSPDVVKSTETNIAFDGSISDFCVKFINLNIAPTIESSAITNEKNTTTNTITTKNTPLNLTYDINISKSGRMVTINGSITNTTIDNIESASEDANFFFEITDSGYLPNTLETFPFLCYGIEVYTYVFFINNKLYCGNIPSGERRYFNATYFTQN